jgi:adenylate cyclase
MIGDSLAKLLGFDTNQLAVRTKIKNNEEVSLSTKKDVAVTS